LLSSCSARRAASERRGVGASNVPEVKSATRRALAESNFWPLDGKQIDVRVGSRRHYTRTHVSILFVSHFHRLHHSDRPFHHVLNVTHSLTVLTSELTRNSLSRGRWRGSLGRRGRPRSVERRKARGTVSSGVRVVGVATRILDTGYRSQINIRA